MTVIVEVLTLIGVSLDLLSTIALACLAGHCESDCCGLLRIEHDDKARSRVRVVQPNIPTPPPSVAIPSDFIGNPFANE